MNVRVYVTLKRGVLDPQGKTVKKSLASLGFDMVKDVRVGKYIELSLSDTLKPEQAKQQVEKMCQKLLANEVIEEYRFDL